MVSAGLNIPSERTWTRQSRRVSFSELDKVRGMDIKTSLDTAHEIGDQGNRLYEMVLENVINGNWLKNVPDGDCSKSCNRWLTFRSSAI